VKTTRDYLTTGLVGQFANLHSDLNVLQKIITRGVLTDAAGAIAKFFAKGALGEDLSALGVHQGFLAAGGDDLITGYTCDGYDDVRIIVDAELDSESSFPQINSQSTLMFTAVAATRSVHLESGTCTTSMPNPTPTKGASLLYNPGFETNAAWTLSVGASYQSLSPYQEERYP